MFVIIHCINVIFFLSLVLCLFYIVDHSVLVLLQTSLAALHELHNMYWASSGWMAGSTKTVTLLVGDFGTCMCFFSLCLHPLSHCLYLIKVFVSFRLFMIVDWVLCASTFFTYARTCLFVKFYFLQSLQAPLLYLPACHCHSIHV